MTEDGRAQPEFFIPTSGCPGKILRGLDSYRVESGDSLILDMGVRYEGYTSDYKRIWYFLRPGETQAPADLRRGFTLVRDVIAECAGYLRAGLQGYEVDELAQSRMVQAGYEEFKHALGHQVGMAVHDGGAILGRKHRYRGASMVVKPSMVFTLEPGIKMPEHYPVGVEEVCLTQLEGSARLFVPPQQELFLVPPEGPCTPA